MVDLAVRFEQRFGKLLLTLNYDHTLNMAEAVASHVLDVALTHERRSRSGISCQDLPPEDLILVETPHLAESGSDPVVINLGLGEG